MAKSWKWITTVGKSRFRSVLNEALRPLPSRPPPTDSALPHTPLSLCSAWTAFSLHTLACASHSSAALPQIHLTDPTAGPDVVGAPSLQSAFALPPAQTRNRVLCFPNNPPPSPGLWASFFTHWMCEEYLLNLVSAQPLLCLLCNDKMIL